MTLNVQKEIQYKNFKWIDIRVPDKENLDEIAKEYKLDYHQIKDSQEFGHLPKFEKQPEYNFCILRAFTSAIEQRATTINELSNKIAFFYNSNKLITIHRAEFDFIESVKSDYSNAEEVLLFLIRKMLVTYEQPLNELDDKIDQIEKTIFLRDTSKVSLKELYFLKAQTRITKKLLLLNEGVINQIEVIDQLKTTLQDIKDKLVRLILNFDEVIENANNLLHTYLSVNAQTSNDVMKLLTIFSAFFLPLTFVAGIYGMNFTNMPELNWKVGYFLTLAVMAVISVIIYLWFKKKQIL